MQGRAPRDITSTLWHDAHFTMNQSSYLDKLYLPRRCRVVTSPLRRRCCRGCRAPGNSPGPSRCPRCTPRTPCRGWTHSWTACPGLQDTWCRARTAARARSCSSRSCTRSRRRWSPCRAPSCGADLCTPCRADTSPCDWSFRRRFHLEGEERWKKT